jgi:hypothetical protein
MTGGGRDHWRFGKAGRSTSDALKVTTPIANVLGIGHQIKSLKARYGGGSAALCARHGLTCTMPAFGIHRRY